MLIGKNHMGKNHIGRNHIGKNHIASGWPSTTEHATTHIRSARPAATLVRSQGRRDAGSATQRRAALWSWCRVQQRVWKDALRSNGCEATTPSAHLLPVAQQLPIHKALRRQEAAPEDQELVKVLPVALQQADQQRVSCGLHMQMQMRHFDSPAKI